MAFVLTYDTLTDALKNYLLRRDSNFISSIPLFIMLGERRCARDLKILPLKVAITDNMTPGSPVIQKPTRWLNDSYFNIATGDASQTRTPVEQRSYAWCREYWPDSTKEGTPKFYASDYNYNYWFFTPTPDFAYPYEVVYYETPQFIDETTSTNYLTENVPEVLLYACLLETASFLKDDERIVAWTDYYDKSVKNIGDENRQRIYDSFSRRDG